MSVRVMSAVWDCDLPPDEKFLALALADWASDDGSHIFASQSHMAWKIGKTDRAVRTTLKKLIDGGVLVPEGKHYFSGSEGHGGTIEYRLDVSKLPQRSEWVSPFSRSEDSSYRDSRPEVCDTPVGSLRHPTRKPTSDNPLELTVSRTIRSGSSEVVVNDEEREELPLSFMENFCMRNFQNGHGPDYIKDVPQHIVNEVWNRYQAERTN